MPNERNNSEVANTQWPEFFLGNVNPMVVCGWFLIALGIAHPIRIAGAILKVALLDFDLNGRDSLCGIASILQFRIEPAITLA